MIERLPSYTTIIREMRGRTIPPGWPDDHLIDIKNQLIDDQKKSFQRCFDIILFLLNNKANPSVCDKHEGNTPLHILIRKIDLRLFKEEYQTILDYFWEKGVNINAKNNLKFTLLHEAAYSGDIIALKFLLDHDALTNERTLFGKTPLDIAKERGHEEIINYLIKMGAKTGDELPKNEEKMEVESNNVNALKIFGFLKPTFDYLNGLNVTNKL